jgi:hypothetical protein
MPTTRLDERTRSMSENSSGKWVVTVSRSAGSNWNSGRRMPAVHLVRGPGTVVPATATISLEKTSITQHEPVILAVAFNSTSQQSVAIDLGYENEKVGIRIIDPEGRVSQKPQSVWREGARFSEGGDGCSWCCRD